MAKAKTTKKKSSSVKKETKKEAKQPVKQLITKDMLIGEVASKYPETIEVMFKHGMHCIGCGMTAYETLEQGCMGHGMNEEEVSKMVEDMNKLAVKKAK
jgi:hybrid cluster-associated redox disulfide protein